MHACLDILEILSAIFEHPSLSQCGPDFQTLWSLAVTCQWFREPAVSILGVSLCPACPWSNTYRRMHGRFIGRLSVSCSCIPATESHPSPCPRRQLEDRDFYRCRANVRHIRHIGDTDTNFRHMDTTDPELERDRLEIELSIYDALEDHGILPIKQLGSHRSVGSMNCLGFPRILGPGPDVVR